MRAPCSEEEPCPGTQLCLPDAQGNHFCMMQCNLETDGTVCIDGAACVPTGATLGVCYSGGPVPVGGMCEDLLDCQRGATCVDIGGIVDGGQCYYACDLGTDEGIGACPDPMRCIATTSGNGFCIR